MISISHLTYLLQLYYFGKLLNAENHEFGIKLIFPMLQATVC